MVAVIGDVHGCFYTLQNLITKVRKSYPDLDLFCVGDLIDRGNYSKEVLDFFQSENIKFTPGNHDYMFYFFMKQPASDMGRAWIYNGFESTISSFNDHYDKIAQYLQMIKSAPLFYNLKDCFISHAGISKFFKSKFPKDFNENPDTLNEFIAKNVLSEHGILWTRDQLLNIGKLQIVGHTRQDDVNYVKSSNAAYIDTSVYTGNKLSCVIVEDNIIKETISVSTEEKDIEWIE